MRAPHKERRPQLRTASTDGAREERAAKGRNLDQTAILNAFATCSSIRPTAPAIAFCVRWTRAEKAASAQLEPSVPLEPGVKLFCRTEPSSLACSCSTASWVLMYSL